MGCEGVLWEGPAAPAFWEGWCMSAHSDCHLRAVLDATGDALIQKKALLSHGSRPHARGGEGGPGSHKDLL